MDAATALALRGFAVVVVPTTRKVKSSIETSRGLSFRGYRPNSTTKQQSFTYETKALCASSAVRSITPMATVSRCACAGYCSEAARGAMPLASVDWPADVALLKRQVAEMARPISSLRIPPPPLEDALTVSDLVLLFLNASIRPTTISVLRGIDGVKGAAAECTQVQS